MSRRKGEVTGHMNERDFPHLVELELPPGGFRSQNPAQLAETRLPGWACKIRTQKRRRKLSL
jgi:hypothetical protein